jgi:hypothetical protein
MPRFPAAKNLVKNHKAAIRGFLALAQERNAHTQPASHPTWKALVNLMFHPEIGPFRQWGMWTQRAEASLYALFKKVITLVYDEIQFKIENDIPLDLGNATESLDKFADMYVEFTRTTQQQEMNKQESSNLQAAQQLQMEMNENQFLLRPPPDDSHRHVHGMHSTSLSFSSGSGGLASGASVPSGSTMTNGFQNSLGDGPRGEKRPRDNAVGKENTTLSYTTPRRCKDTVEVLDTLSAMFARSDEALAKVLGSVENTTPAFPTTTTVPASSTPEKPTKIDRLNKAILSLQATQAQSLANQDTKLHEQISMQLFELQTKRYELLKQSLEDGSSPKNNSHM